MATSAKLVTDLTVTLRAIRSHEGVVATRIAQASSDAVVRELRGVEKQEAEVADRVVDALHRLGAPAPRTRPSWLPSPASLASTAVTASQPLGEALVLEATTVRMIADRARVVHGLAVAVERADVADAAAQVSDLYDDYAGWLVRTASALVVDEDDADLTPTAVQRVAGRVKDVAGASMRVPGQVGDRVLELVGLGRREVVSTVEDAVDHVQDAADRVQDAVTPDQASDLPITRYDSRPAADVAAAVRGLGTVDDVSTVLAYESRHKDRKTVIEAGDTRISQLTNA